MAERTIGAGVLSGVLTQDVVAAIIIAFLAAMISGLTQYNAARKNDLISFDTFDLLLAILSSLFAGLMGYLGAGFFIEQSNVLLFITGLSSIAGFQGLISVKDLMIDVLRSRLLPDNKSQTKYNNDGETPPDDWNQE